MAITLTSLPLNPAYISFSPLVAHVIELYNSGVVKPLYSGLAIKIPSTRHSGLINSKQEGTRGINIRKIPAWNKRTCCTQLVLEGLCVRGEGGRFHVGTVDGEVQALQIDGFDFGTILSHDTYGIITKHFVVGPIALATAKGNNLGGILDSKN